MLLKYNILQRHLRRILIGAIAVMPVTGVMSQVKIYRQPVTIPTYGVMPPEKMPDWGEYHYPYSMLDRLTNIKGSRTYHAIYLENEYVKAMVLPEIGGRLHEAQDKTNGYEFLYNQKVIKPALIGLTGAWISGGIEWNFPIGHRQTGFRNVDWKMVKNADSSKTVWVGETDRLTGMRWSVGITVYPGRNWIETKVRLFNCTPYMQRFQYWATSAVRATYNYQAVIPTEIMTGHGKQEYYHWPVNNGVDLSYWKNTPGASSYFAIESQSDYFGGYSPEENAGMVHVADHQIVRGKKLWTWGTAPAGRLWEKLLTDGDLPYFEPQAGAYSDNQPSLFWIMPGETKIFSHFWFPVRDIGVFDYANLEGTLSLKVNDEKVKFGWSPTGKNPDAQIVLTHDGTEFFSQKVNADPAHPYIGEAALPAGADLYHIAMHVLSSDGDTLLTYMHKRPTHPSLPGPLQRPLPPERIQSQDELYVVGDLLNRYNETGMALDYFHEALRRDSGDVRCNTALGIIALKEGLFAQSLARFNRAIERDETYFEAWYYKGLVQQWKGDLTDAENSLNRASYDQTWYAAAHLDLARLTANLHHYDMALDHIDRSIRNNGDNNEAKDVKSLILYQTGHFDEAMAWAKNAQQTDPMDQFAQALLYVIRFKTKPGESETDKYLEKLLQLTRLDENSHLELAIRFARNGCYTEAEHMLDLLTAQAGHALISPMLYYYLAYYHIVAGDSKLAGDFYRKASEADPVYCFPERLEDMDVLEKALEYNPNDSRAQYLLGNILFSKTRIWEAIARWEKSVILDPSNAVAYRNLGYAYHEQGELQKAKADYEAAVRADPTAGQAVVELGLLNAEMKIPYPDQIALFEKNTGVVAAYNQAAKQLIELYVITGRYSDALKWLKELHFNSWEGQYGIHQYWEQSNLKQGDLEFGKKDYVAALKYYQESLTYPDNLEVAEQPGTLHARNDFKIGMALSRLGQKAQALTYFRKAVADSAKAGNAFQYYRGLALEAMGEKEKARAVFADMLQDLGEHTPDEESDSRIQAVHQFCRSLALEGLGNNKEAESEREQALEKYPLAEISAFRPPRSGF